MKIISDFRNKDEELKKFYVLFFTALSAALSFFEYIIPRPLPWLKLGLANCIPLAFIFCKNYKTAFFISLFRPIIVSIFIGNIFSPGFFLSIFGSVFSTLMMILFHKFSHKFLSYIGISLMGAYTHSFTQLAVAYFFNLIYSLNSILIVGGVISIMSIFGAIITGYIASRLVKRL